MAKKNKKLDDISALINVRNYMLNQTENSKLSREISHKYVKYVIQLDKQIAEQIISHFEEVDVNESNKQ